MSHSYEEKLEKWGLSEYIQNFKDENIDEQAFLYMPEYMVKELIPTIGKRFCFLENRKKLLKFEKEYSVSETSTDLGTSEIGETISIASCSSKESFDNRGQALKELLSESSCDRKILTQTRLTASDRNKLSHLIIDKLLCRSMKISSADFQKWAEEIVSLFKYETISTYYVPSNTKQKRLANGKLWDKYNNLKRLIKKQAIDENKENTENSDYNETLLILRAIQPDDPRLLKLWEETFNERRKGTSIAQYYDDYPILKCLIATSLIRIDYGIATGIDTWIFQKKWPEICPYVIQIAENKQACPSLCELKHDVPVEVLSLFILPYIINTCHVKTGNKKKWKPSKIEVAESFICRIPNIAQLEPTLQQRKDKLRAVGLTLQPTVIAVGSLINFTSFYVIVNDVKYTSTSLPNAIDLCFQIFFALDAKYPVDCEKVWYFLQQYVYCIINEKYYRNFVSLDIIWHDINELMSTSK